MAKFYSNRLRGKSAKEKSQVLTFSGGINTVLDDLLLPQSVSRVSYNCNGKSGALAVDTGISALELEGADGAKHTVTHTKKILRCWFFKHYNETLQRDDDRIVVLDEAGEIFEVKLADPAAGLTKIAAPPFSSVPCAICYKLGTRDVLLLSSKTDKLTVYDGESAPTQIDGSPQISSMCIHYERLFACGDGNTLWFSDDLDPTNWRVSLDEAGFIEFADEKGKLLKVISFLDYLFIFRRYGITRMHAYASQEEFSASQIFTTGGRIYENSLAVCGENIIFLSGDGLYLFDGLGTKRLLPAFDKLFEGVDNENSCAAFFSGKYYLACRLNFADGKKVLCENGEYVNNALMTFDLNTGSVSLLRGVDAAHMSVASGENLNRMMLTLRGQNGKNLATVCEAGTVFGTPLPKCWLCPETILGSTLSSKQLLYLAVATRHPIELGICADGVWRFYTVEGGAGYRRVDLNLTAKIVRAAFFSDGAELYVRPVELRYLQFN